MAGFSYLDQLCCGLPGFLKSKFLNNLQKKNSSKVKRGKKLCLFCYMYSFHKYDLHYFKNTLMKGLYYSVYLRAHVGIPWQYPGRFPKITFMCYVGWKQPKNINLLHAFGIQVPFYCNYGHFQKNNEIFEKIWFFFGFWKKVIFG